ncbi:sigma-70 family RNA polymerase sigma factor [Methylomonas albis]|uniref:Sigma-70 family RNA polymerase sigma factor n=1 Tax=Methylomonas albis TaxID=1854563 RepID=A0ABR9D023_9GAMM|nr:sigma-70 family RNA polymerase sigma factor [Methylomonas albis]MBD9355584.1 sigma-70 family RNA polymerase sigma factor [Methylomonas albis]
MSDQVFSAKSSDSGAQAEPSAEQIAAFIDKHRDELSRFIVRKLGSEDMSADILQDAYLRLSRQQTQETIDNPRAFVFRVVGNLVIDYQRLSANRLKQDVDDDTFNAVPEQSPGPEQRYQQNQRLQAIHQALAELPEDCRLAFYWNRVEGLSHTEVAARLRISDSMVAKHLARAMRHCRDRLKQH